MANTSIFAAFERMWQHVTVALSNKADSNHNHDEYVTDPGIPVVAATSTDGVVYTGTSEDISELTAGVTVVFIPDKTSTSTAPTFNLNNLGAKTIKRRLSGMSSTTASGNSADWLYVNKPQLLMYDGAYWIVVNQDKPQASDFDGNVGGDKVSYDNSTSGMTASTMQAAVDELASNIPPAYTYGTEDLIAGTSALETGKIYLVYE